MLSSYLKQASIGSNHRTRLSKAVAPSYSSGSDFSDDDTSDYSSSILSLGSSTASPASASEPSSWKHRATFSSTQDEALDDDDDIEQTIVLSDMSSTMGTESMTILPSLISGEAIATPKNAKRRMKSGRPSRETFRPDHIDTLASPQYGMDALCSGVPIDCQSLDSQISILDRACDDLNIDDFASARCVNKLIEADRKRSFRKRERALETLHLASQKWDECRDESEDKTNLDEVEIVFDRSTTSDERSGSLWNGLTLWEMKAPGSSPKREAVTPKRENDVLGSNVIIFSPAPSLRELPKRSPRIDSTMLDNSTIPTETLDTGKVNDARTLVANCGHAISSKLRRRGRSSDANSLKSFSESVDSPMKINPFTSPAGSEAKKGHEEQLQTTEGSRENGDAKAPPIEMEEPDALQSLASSDDDERKPALNIFLTRVPVHPETPAGEGQSSACHDTSLGTKANDATRGFHIVSTSATTKSPSRLDQLKRLFHESNRDVAGDSRAGGVHDSVEIMQEENGVELRSGLHGKKTMDGKKSKTSPQPTSMHVEQVAVDQRPTAISGSKTGCLYDSEGNTISPGALKRIELAPKTPRDLRSSSRSRSVVSESNTMLAETSISPGRNARSEPRSKVTASEAPQARPSVRDLVKAFNEKEAGGEKKKVLRVFSSSHKRNSKDVTSRTRTERQTSRSLPPAPPLRRSYVSDVGPQRDCTPRTEEPEEAEIPLRRSVSLSKSKASEFDSTKTLPSSFLYDDNSILAPVENERLSHELTVPSGKPRRPIVDIDAHEKAQRQAPIEFSPIEFPIVSKQICSTDRLTREFIIQGASQEPPVVLYPLLDFNPCYEVFILPSDVENHTFEKRRTLKPPPALESKSELSERKNQEKDQAPLSLRSSPKASRGMGTSNGIGEGGIEVALAESHRARSMLPNEKQLLGYVSHSSHADLRKEVEVVSAHHAADQTLHESAESSSRTASQTKASRKTSDSSDHNPRLRDNKTATQFHDELSDPLGNGGKADGVDNRKPLPSFISKQRRLQSETGTEDAIYEPSIEISGSSETNHITRPKKHVTFRNWNVPSSFTTSKPKTQSSQPKSILRPSNTSVRVSDCHVEEPNLSSDPDNVPMEVVSAPAMLSNVTKTSPNGTPKTSNRFAKRSIRLSRLSKTKIPDDREKREDREPIASIRDERANQVERSEPEGFEVEPGSHILLPAARSSFLDGGKTSLWSKARLEKRASAQLEIGSRPKDEASPPEKFRLIRKKKETDTSTMMATVGDVRSQGDVAAKSKIDISPSLRKAEKRTEIPEKLPLAPSADDEFGFLDDSPPASDTNRARGHKDDDRRGERSASLERVSRWISGMRPSSQQGTVLSKRDRQQILKRSNKSSRRFDDSALFRKSNVPIEKEVYNLLMEGNKTQEDIYQTLTEIAIARKRPNQSLAQAMSELEREVFQVYSDKCREKSERKLARRREFDRKLMRAVRKKTERALREESEKVRRQRDQEPSLFQEAVDFLSSFVVCTEDVGLSPRRTPRSPSRRAKISCLSSPDEEVVYTPKSDKRTFFA